MSIVLLGSTSGSVTLQEPAVAGTTVLTLPAVSGTLITTASSGQSIPKAALPTGSVLQVVQAVKTDTATTSSLTFGDITGLSVSITPTSATSKILVLLTLGGIAINPNAVQINLVRNSTNIAQPDSGPNKATMSPYPGAINASRNSSINWLDSPATTSATTYKVQWCVDGGTAYLNRHISGLDYNSVSTITVMEIAA
jgi:hypothetical protein